MEQIIINGDNLEVLKKYPDNYFDAVVTDPPYGLGKEPNASEVMQSWVSNGYHEIKGSGFMGKEWDAFVPQPIFWKEVFRVLKHGGHVLSFFGTRTYDWGVMSMRFAGFEVKDTIYWHYGSGFPKSHNISKSIDKLYGAEREEVGILKGMGKQNPEWNGTAKGRSENSFKNEYKKTNPATEEAKKFEGWGSALKPASEPIVVARKQLEKGLSIAQNVLKWGTGGINIDGCRISTNGESWERKNNVEYRIENNIKPTKSLLSNGNGAFVNSNPKGRFPANLLMTHHPECEYKGLKKIKPSNGSGKASDKGGGFSKGMFGDGTSDNIGGGFIDENGQETVEDWECVNGGELISPCIYLEGIEINKFNFHHYLNVIQLHRANSHILATLYIHNKDRYNFLDCETFHDLGWKRLPSFRVYYQFLSHFYDALVQTFQVYDQLSVQQLNDALDAAHHLLELLHNHLHQDHDHLSKQNDSVLYSLSQHIYLNKSFYSVFLNKISYRNVDILFQELEQNDVRDNILENKIFADFLSYLTKMHLNNSSILHLRQMLFCLSLEINFSNQIYYKKFELPDCPIKIMDEQSGILKSGDMNGEYNGFGYHEIYGKGGKREAISYGDKGGASRFFYCAKASKSERNKGLDGFEDKYTPAAEFRPNHMEKAIEGEDGNPYGRWSQVKNIHPTVKPVKLMQYLVRLVTPPKGKVLDPFAGSGTTGIACKLEGFEFVGIEQEVEYCKIAEARIKNFVEEKDEEQIEADVEKEEEPTKNSNYTQQTLF